MKFPKFPSQVKIGAFISNKLDKTIELGPNSPLNKKDRVLIGSKLTGKNHLVNILLENAKNKEYFIFKNDSWSPLLKSKDMDFKVQWLYNLCLKNIDQALEYMKNEDKIWLLKSWKKWLQDNGPSFETLEEFFEIIKRCHIYPTAFFFENWDEMLDKSMKKQFEGVDLHAGLGDPISSLIMSQNTKNHEYSVFFKSLNLNENSLLAFNHHGANEERFYSIPLESADLLLKSDPFPFNSNLSANQLEKETSRLKQILEYETVPYPWIYKLIAEYYTKQKDGTIQNAWDTAQKQIYLYISQILPEYVKSLSHESQFQFMQNHAMICSEIFDYFIAKRSKSIGSNLQQFLLVESLTYFSDFRSRKAHIHPISIAVQNAMIDFWIPLESRMWNFEGSVRFSDIKDIFYQSTPAPRKREAIIMELLRRFLCDRNEKNEFIFQLRNISNHEVNSKKAITIKTPLRFVRIEEDSKPSILKEYIGKGTTFFIRDAKELNTPFQLIIQTENESIFFKNVELNAFFNDVEIDESWVSNGNGNKTIVLLLPQKQYLPNQEERFLPSSWSNNIYVSLYEDWIQNLQEINLLIRDQKRKEKKENQLFEDVNFTEKELDQLMKLSKKLRLLDTKERSIRGA